METTSFTYFHKGGGALPQVRETNFDYQNLVLIIVIEPYFFFIESVLILTN